MNKNLVTISCNTTLSANMDMLMEKLGVRKRSELFKLGLYALARQLGQAEEEGRTPSLDELLEGMQQKPASAPSFREFCGHKPAQESRPASAAPKGRVQAECLPHQGLPLAESALPLLLPGESATSRRLRHISRFTYELHAFVGWRVLIYRGDKRFQRYFSDIRHGGAAGALAAALEARSQVFAALERWPGDPQRAFDSVPGGRTRGTGEETPGA